MKSTLVNKKWCDNENTTLEYAALTRATEFLKMSALDFDDVRIDLKLTTSVNFNKSFPSIFIGVTSIQNVLQQKV